uniref:Cuticular protein n=1 Tax=Tenebrio molitor TaxID=7067 RepID=O18508_TENMO|nr:cuticular protein [Tenebrio molitor]
MKFLAVAPLAYSTNLVSGHVAAPVSYSAYSVAHNAVAAPVSYSYNTVAAPVAYSSIAAPVAHAVAAPVAHTVAHHAVAAPVAHTVAHTVAAPVAHTVATHAVAAPVAHTVATHAVAAPVTHAVATHAVAAPVAHAVAAPIVAAPVVQKTQYHAQDELGQASYGHSEPLQVHNAVQDAAGNKVGSYSYVAPNGQVIAANYVADGLGYRVASNALPVGPGAVPVAPADTPEVVAARIAHLNQHALVKSRARRGILAGYHAPLVHSSYAYSAPVFRAATLSTVVNAPGHAVSYHVY